jgi:hypothetical protein
MSARTIGPGVQVSSTVGTTAAVALTANPSRQFVQLQNIHPSQSLGYTVDGSTPVIGTNGFVLVPYGSVTLDVYVATGAITVIGSAASTAYCILSA